tara:strand:- start:100 stop:378 length:279 start_codon:yes stop_codon:yes gene_type:complete
MIDIKDKNIDWNFKKTQRDVEDVAGFLIEFTTPDNPADEIELVHRLGRIPQEVHTVLPREGCFAFPGDTGWTDNKIYLKGTIAGRSIKVRIR